MNTKCIGTQIENKCFGWRIKENNYYNYVSFQFWDILFHFVHSVSFHFALIDIHMINGIFSIIDKLNINFESMHWLYRTLKMHFCILYFLFLKNNIAYTSCMSIDFFIIRNNCQTYKKTKWIYINVLVAFDSLHHKIWKYNLYFAKLFVLRFFVVVVVVVIVIVAFGI